MNQRVRNSQQRKWQILRNACHNLGKVEASSYYNLRFVLKMWSVTASALCHVFYRTQSIRRAVWKE